MFKEDTLEHYTAEAIALIKEYEPATGYILCFSGGKDSEVLLSLAKKAGVKYKPIYHCTRIDPPQLVRHIKKHHPEVQFVFPKKSFWKYIRHRSLPTIHQRWCCDMLKHGINKKMEKLYDFKLIGIRAEESNKRAKYSRVERKRKEIYPIFHWKAWHIWQYIEDEKIPYCELYDQGFERIGCMICPFSSNSVKEKEVFAKYFRIFEKVAKENLYNHKNSGKHNFRKDMAFEEYIDAWYKQDIHLWYDDSIGSAGSNGVPKEQQLSMESK